jgi:hypothetical protein
MMKRGGIKNPVEHPAIKNDEHFPEVLKRAKEQSVATVTKVNGEYLNLKFDDGFECGAERKNILRAE